jgi:hypothetical protein
MADDPVWEALVKRCGVQPDKQAPTGLPISQAIQPTQVYQATQSNGLAVEAAFDKVYQSVLQKQQNGKRAADSRTTDQITAPPKRT